MFEAASQNVVLSCGDDCLHHVPSLFESEDFKLLHIVVKKRRKFFFLRPKLTATPFHLKDLLIGQNDDFKPEVVTATMLKDFRKDYKLSLKGNAGTKLKTMFEMELAGKDDVDVECNLGDLEKQSLDIPKFIAALKGRKVNLQHDFIKQIRRNKRKSLCVVVGTVSLTKDCAIETKLDREGDEKFSFDKLKIATVDESASCAVNRDKSMVLPKGTTLAYDAYELSVRTTGTIELIMDDEVKGGFGEDLVDGSRVPTPPACSSGLASLFTPIVSADRSTRVLLRRAVLDLCSHPQAFHRFYDIFKEARRCMKNDEKLFTTVGKLKTEVDVTFDSWLELLKFADFKIETGKVTYPMKTSDTFEAMYKLLECLHELPDDRVLVLFSQLTNNLAPALATVLYEASQHPTTPIPMSDTALKAIYDCENAAQSMLYQLGFYISEGETLCPPRPGVASITALYQVLYSLFDCRR